MSTDGNYAHVSLKNCSVTSLVVHFSFKITTSYSVHVCPLFKVNLITLANRMLLLLLLIGIHTEGDWIVTKMSNNILLFYWVEYLS